MIEPPPLQQVDRTYVRFQNRTLSYFSGCDYFRLASHPKVIQAMRDGLKRFGLNVAASRLTTGNHVLYGELERQLADFFAAEDALLVPNGYATNLVVAQAVAADFSHVVVDEKAHPSLLDAARFLRGPVLQFKHRNVEDCARMVRRCGKSGRILLLTDGMFAHDGSIAPLAAYLKILPASARVLVDDAHGAGTLGKTGKGAVEFAGVSCRQIVQTITLSKAFGVYGGAILGTRALRKAILDRSQCFAGSTPLPLPLAAAALQAVKILKTDASLRHCLVRNADYVKRALRKAGFQMPDTPGPIVAMVPRRQREAELLKRALLMAGIYPPFIKYPGGPANGNFRFVVSSGHSRSQLDSLLKVLVTFTGAK